METTRDLTTLHGMTGELSITDIGEGQQGDCTLCPVTLAVGRMFPKCEVHADLDTVTIHKGGETVTYLRVSDPLAEWMDAFDNENDVNPIHLRIDTWTLGGYKYMIDIAEEDTPVSHEMTGTFHLCWSQGDEMVFLDRESLEVWIQVLCNFTDDDVPNPTAEAEDIINQCSEMARKFAELNCGYRPE